MSRAFPSVVIENLQPLIDGGRYPIKRIVGEDLVVDADIFKDGHDVVAAVLKWRVLGKRAWRETPMTFSVFVDGLVIECTNPAPPIVIDESHGRFPPCAFPKNTPLQNGRHHVVAVFKNVRVYG